MSGSSVARSEKALSLGIGAEEWALRVQLAACYRIFDLLGWTEYIFNHITLRVPGPEKHFLINPFGLWYSEVTASNLVKIDYSLSRRWSLRAETGTSSGGGLFYRFSWD